MKFLRQLLLCASLAVCAGAAFGAGALPAHYSFMDVYRLAVLGAPLADDAAAPALPLAAAGAAAQPQPAPFQAPSADYQIRVASAGAQPALPLFSVAAPQLLPAGLAYSSSVLPAPSRWLLILSGLALAAWVARRRLGYSL